MLRYRAEGTKICASIRNVSIEEMNERKGGKKQPHSTAFTVSHQATSASTSPASGISPEAILLIISLQPSLNLT